MNNLKQAYLCLDARDLKNLHRGIFSIMGCGTFMSGRDLGEIKIIAGWSRYKSEMSTGVSGAA